MVGGLDEVAPARLLGNHQVAKMFKRAGEKLPEIMPPSHQLLDQGNGARGIMASHQGRDPKIHLVIHHMERIDDLSGSDAAAAERDHLIEQALRIAQGAVGAPRNKQQSVIVNRNLLGVGDPPEILRDLRNGDTAEFKSLTAGKDGRRDFVASPSSQR